MKESENLLYELRRILRILAHCAFLWFDDIQGDIAHEKHSPKTGRFSLHFC